LKNTGKSFPGSFFKKLVRMCICPEMGFLKVS
jgi:hypothetical protein